MSLFSALGTVLSGGSNKFLKSVSGALGGKDVFTGINPIHDYTGITAAKMQQDISEKNLELQRNQFDYQKQLNEREWNYQVEQNALTRQREDTAYQRKVADLKAAGLNPVLAAGGSGSAAAGVSVPSLRSANAPQLDSSFTDKYAGAGQALASLVFQAISMKKDFAQKDAMIGLLRAQKDKTEAEALSVDTENMYLEDRLLNENAGLRLRNEGQAGRNVYQGYQNAIAENELYISSSTKFAQVEDRLLSVDQRRKNLLNIDADLILKADKHLWYQYENNLQDVRSIWAGKLASKEFDIRTYEAVAKALTITQVEEDVKLYMKAKEELMKKYKDPQVVRRKLALQFGSYSSIYDQLQDVITGAGHKAGEFLRDLGIDFHF